MPELQVDLAAAPQGPIAERDELPYRVTGLERRTPTIVELWLRPLVKPLEYLPGE